MDKEALQAMLEEELAKAGGTDGGLFLGMSGWTLLFGFVFGVFGWWIFRQGRKKANPPLIGIGIALMVYPYFVFNPWLCFAVGAGLCLGAYRLWN